MDGLDGRYDVAGVDRTIRRPPNVRRRNLARSRGLAGIFAGADAVVDLAGDPDPRAEWKDVRRNNLAVTLNVLDAARRAGVRRYVFASSNHVTGGYERDEPYSAIVAGDYTGLDPDWLPLVGTNRPVRPEGVRVPARGRLGTVNAENRPLQPRHFATLLTHADLLRLVEAALTADVRFTVCYGVSRNTWRFWDISNEIGYDPQDDAERYRAE